MTGNLAENTKQLNLFLCSIARFHNLFPFRVTSAGSILHRYTDAAMFKSPGLLAVGGLLSSILVFSTISTVWFFRSQRHTGLPADLCKCEKFHSKSRSHSIKPRIINGTEFTSKHGLSWIASIYSVTKELEVPKETSLDYQHLCTGSILNSRTVLAAGITLRSAYFTNSF